MLQRKCSHVEAIFASILPQLGIMKRLVRGLNQPMTARLIKTARSLKIPHEIGLILFSAALPPGPPLSYVRSIKGWFYWSNAVTWCVTWNYQRADRRLSSEEKGTICLYSNVIPTGEEDTTKLRKVTITSSKREKNKTKKKHKQKKAAKLHVSPGCQPTSRWGPPLPPAPPPRFSLCRNITRSSPHHLNSALLFLVLCSETAQKRLLHTLGTGYLFALG